MAGVEPATLVIVGLMLTGSSLKEACTLPSLAPKRLFKVCWFFHCRRCCECFLRQRCGSTGQFLIHGRHAPKGLYWSAKGALEDESLDFRFFRSSSVLAPTTLSNGFKNGPGAAPGHPGDAP